LDSGVDVPLFKVRNIQLYCMGECLDGRVARRRVVGVVPPLPMAQPTRCDSRTRPGLQAHLWKRRQTGRGGPGRRFQPTEGRLPNE